VKKLDKAFRLLTLVEERVGVVAEGQLCEEEIDERLWNGGMLRDLPGDGREESQSRGVRIGEGCTA
jgi:hypothetical protein